MECLCEKRNQIQFFLVEIGETKAVEQLEIRSETTITVLSTQLLIRVR